jgi:hypothetical protein
MLGHLGRRSQQAGPIVTAGLTRLSRKSIAETPPWPGVCVAQPGYVLNPENTSPLCHAMLLLHPTRHSASTRPPRAQQGSVPDLLIWVLDRTCVFIAIHEESKDEVMPHD